MNKKNAIILLSFVIIAVFALRMYLTVPQYTFESYGTLRKIEGIKETGLPIYSDDLSWAGRQNIYLAGFHYIAAFLTFISFHTFQQLLVVLLMPLAAMFALKITRDWDAFFVTGLTTGFIPILYGNNIAGISPFSIALPLSLLALFFFIDRPYHFIAVMCFLAFIHPFVIVILISLVLYLIMQYADDQRVCSRDTEAIFFTAAFTFWIMFVFFKKAILFHGEMIIFGNIPVELLSSVYAPLSTSTAIISIGIIPLLASAYFITTSIFAQSRNITLLVSALITTAAIMFVRILPLDTGLAFVGVIITIIFGQFYCRLRTYLEKTKISRVVKYLPFLTAGIVIMSSLYPCMNAPMDIPSEEEIQLIESLKELDSESIILAPLKYGHMITYMIQRKNVWDTDFLLVDSEMFKTVQTVYNSRSITESIEKFKQARATHVIVTDIVPEFIHEPCIQKLFENSAGMVLKNTCKIKTTKIIYSGLAE